MTINLENIQVKPEDRIETSQFYDYPRRDREDVRAYLNRIPEILELGAFDTAVASAIFVLEAILPWMAEEQDIEFESKAPTQLLQVFYQNQLVSLETCDILTQAIAVRDAFRAKQETQNCDRQFAEQVFSQVTDLFHSFEG